MPDTLAAFSQKEFFAQVPLLVLTLQIVAIVLYYLVMVAALLVDRQAGEVALLKSRGAGAKTHPRHLRGRGLPARRAGLRAGTPPGAGRGGAAGADTRLRRAQRRCAARRPPDDHRLRLGRPGRRAGLLRPAHPRHPRRAAQHRAVQAVALPARDGVRLPPLLPRPRDRRRGGAALLPVAAVRLAGHRGSCSATSTTTRCCCSPRRSSWSRWRSSSCACSRCCCGRPTP